MEYATEAGREHVLLGPVEPDDESSPLLNVFPGPRRRAPKAPAEILEGRREDVFRAIVQLTEKRCGLSPTIREIGKATGISSTSVVNYHVRKLEDEGRLERVPGASRGIIVVGAVWSLPGNGERLAA